MTRTEPYVPPPYPYDRLNGLKPIAAEHDGGVIDLSIGTPCDPPPQVVLDALATSDTERGYPPSIGTAALRDAIVRWFDRRVGVTVDAGQVAAAVGTKEFVAGTPSYLRMRYPDRDTVLYPAVSYPSYEMGAVFAGCRAVPVPVDDQWRIDLSQIDPADAARALMLWVNTPGNPAGGLDDLAAAAEWGRANDVIVVSDECYVEFTWDGPAQSILQHGLDGVLAVHSLSKRSNLAGLRVGFYAGDPELVHYLSELRKHGGFMVPGPAQAAGAAALDDDEHVAVQRDRYHRRMSILCEALQSRGIDVEMPGGGFYLWAAAPGGDAWAFAEELARVAGVISSPGEFYGEVSADRVRLAVVRDDDAIERAAARLRR